MANRKFTLLAVLLLAVYVASAVAQGWPTGIHRVGDIIVAKNPNPDDPMDTPHFTTIQEAVNFAQPGSIIQIMDTSTYNEQVLIDGRGAQSPWFHWLNLHGDPVGGARRPISREGKTDLTIIYIPRGGWGAAGALGYSAGRPTIRYQDTYNRSPRSDEESRNQCELPSDCQTVCFAIHGANSDQCRMFFPQGHPQGQPGQMMRNVGGSGNQETAGALRLLKTSNIRIDGIRISGVQPVAAQLPVWGNLWIGNAAVVIEGSNSITIRNSEIINAMNGIFIKDRNPGGVFANRNPDDMLAPTPLGGFGKMGNHIFEYNRIHRNRRGISFESGWDLGVYIRHNFIFNNGAQNPYASGAPAPAVDGQYNGGIFYRDQIFQPIAIHNNTFFNNDGNIVGGWQIGAPHLIYNNIFGAKRLADDHHELTGKHRNRLHNNVFAAQSAQTQGGQNTNMQWPGHWSGNHNRPAGWPADLRLTNPNGGPGDNEVSEAALNAARTQCQNQSGGAQFQLPGTVQSLEIRKYNTLIGSPAVSPNPGQIFPVHLSASNTFTVPTVGGEELGPFPCRIFIEGYETTANNPVDLGMSGGGNTVNPGTPMGVLPTSAENRFLQTTPLSGFGEGLFQSTDPNNANFLVPIWTNPAADWLRSRGWGRVNNNNTNGALDLGARQFASAERPMFSAHIVPTNVVMIDTAQTNLPATVNYRLNVTDRDGNRRTMQNPQITHLRWVVLPHQRGVSPGGDATMIVNQQFDITPPTPITITSNANSRFTFNLQGNGGIPGGTGTRDSVGAFLEIVISGTVDGVPVTSNVGFLPYRLITHVIDVCVLDPDAPPQSTACRTEVIAGEPYHVRIQPRRPQGGQMVSYLGTINQLEFRLNSGGTHAYMWCADGQPASSGTGGQFGADHNRRCPAEGAFAGDFPAGNVPGESSSRQFIAGDRGTQHGARYRVFFSYAGDETIFATAVTRIDGNEVAFLGTADIRVRPATPAQVEFIRPAPRWTFSMDGNTPDRCAVHGNPANPNSPPLPAGCLRSTQITRGSPFEVHVMAQDRFGNAADVPVTINIVSDAPTIGDAGSPGNITVKSAITRHEWADDLRGIAIFEAQGYGMQGQYFDMTASAVYLGNTLTPGIGRLTLGRPLNQLVIFYGPYPEGVLNWGPVYSNDPPILDGNAIPGPENRLRVTVIAAEPTTLATAFNNWVRIAVSSAGANHDALRFYATQDAATPSEVFRAVNGMVTFWVGVESTPSSSINSACITASAHTAAEALPAQADGAFESGNRCNINLAVPTLGVAAAEILGDGFGRPDSIRLSLRAADGVSPSDYDDYITEVSFVWPPEAVPSDATTYTVSRAAMPTRFRPAASFGTGAVMMINVAGLTANDGVTVLPTGYTSISGSGQGIVSVIFSGEFDNNFPTLDGLGPVIADPADEIAGLSGPMVVENPLFCTDANTPANCRPDTLFIQVSEPVRQTLGQIAEPGTFQIVRTSGGINPNTTAVAGIEPLRVTSALPSGSINGFRLVLDPATPLAPRLESQPEGVAYWIRFDPTASHVEDFANKPQPPANNNPHANNRWVQFTLRPTPPERVDGWYTADVRTGLLDTAYIQFSKPFDPSWLTNGAIINIGGDERTVAVDEIGTTAGTIVQITTGEIEGTPVPNSLVKFCLATFHRSLRTISTTGDLSLNIRYSASDAATRDWGTIPHALVDRAKPVIANDDPTTVRGNAARVIYGTRGDAEHAIDTVVVWLSENVENILQADHISEALRFISYEGGERREGVFQLKFESQRAVRTPYREVRFTFTDPFALNDFQLMSGRDSVRLNVAEMITDEHGNIQDDPDNRAVSLRLQRTADWIVDISSNPGRPGDGPEVVVRPFERATDLRMRATIELYDNVGNVVNTWTTCDLAACETSGSNSGWAVGVRELTWKWNGLNHRGRYAGTGTYLFRARYEAEIVDSQGNPEQGSRVTRRFTFPIGFVR